ncbi:Component of IIS longevity pathway SMK-1 [Carpediemonas membranifera]|uniref:Component of IIS longevity pathway SMK-1 n=1 Tax=Carpediemonas membranifera TaxID=201153 RepID=A0A8J6AYH3_9EUKA|nr:Component of IIS longevity pathway SMK-1 [Carpediemonas membranifera]|eukprot:KAG9391533.1 Component of IIS longevity pathway SMK-1 [Carpediemonas membranifera]
MTASNQLRRSWKAKIYRLEGTSGDQWVDETTGIVVFHVTDKSQETDQKASQNELYLSVHEIPPGEDDMVPVTPEIRRINILEWARCFVHDQAHFIWEDNTGMAFSMSFYSSDHMQLIWNQIVEACSAFRSPTVPILTADTIAQIADIIEGAGSVPQGMEDWVEQDSTVDGLRNLVALAQAEPVAEEDDSDDDMEPREGEDADTAPTTPSTSHLRPALFRLVRGLFNLGNGRITVALMDDTHFPLTLACLEYGPASPGRQLKIELDRLVEGIPSIVAWTNPAVSEAMQRLARMSFMRDVALARLLDDYSAAIVTGQHILATRTVLNMLNGEMAAFKAWFAGPHSLEERASMLAFLDEFNVRSKFYLMLTGDGTGRRVTESLLSAGVLPFLVASVEMPMPHGRRAAEIIHFICTTSTSAARQALIDPPESIDALSRLMTLLTTVDPPEDVVEAVIGAISALLHPPKVGGVKQGSEAAVGFEISSPDSNSRLREGFLDLFYVRCSSALLALIRPPTESMSRSARTTTAHTLTTLAACIPSHALRVSYLIAGHSLFPKLVASLEWADVGCVIAAVRLLKVIVEATAAPTPAAETEFYSQMIIRCNVLGAILALAKRTAPGSPCSSPMVQSACLALLKTAHRIAYLNAVLVTDHRATLVEMTHHSLFTRLLEEPEPEMVVGSEMGDGDMGLSEDLRDAVGT